MAKVATKAQEREALEKIEQIINGLGESSYVAMAMDGMIEDARENIENDFALSWKDRAEHAQKVVADKDAVIAKLYKQNDQLARDLEVAKLDHDELKEDFELVLQKKNDYHDDMIKVSNACAAAEQKVAELEDEVIRLKAKLYDLLVK